MGKVIAVLSGKGGTGKTTVCAGLATSLAKCSAKVLCIDLDAGLRNLDIALGLSWASAPAFSDVAEGKMPLSSSFPHPDFPTLSFLTAPVGKCPEELDPALFFQLMEQVRQEYDYCLLDAPAGVGSGFRMAAQAASLELLVAGPDPGALRDGVQTGSLLELMGKTDVRVIVNRVIPAFYRSIHLTVDDLIDEIGYRLLGLVPEDPHVTLSAIREKPLIQNYRRGAAAACYRIAQRILGVPVPLPRLK